MFVVLYRYSFQKKHFAQWRRITGSANKLYRGYGMRRAERLVSTTTTRIAVVEINYYPSKRSYTRTSARADHDSTVLELYQQLTKFVRNNTITQEMYESI